MIGKTTFAALCLAMYACTFKTGTNGSLVDKTMADIHKAYIKRATKKLLE